MGVQILNKDVSIISTILSKPKANIGNVFGIGGWAGGVVGFVSGDFNFSDVIGAGGGGTNTQISPKTGTLYIYLDLLNFDGVSELVLNKNGTMEYVFDLLFAGPPFEYTLSISSGDTLDFIVNDIVPFPNSLYDSYNVVLRNENVLGTIVDQFLVDLQ